MKMDPSTGKNRVLFERFHIDLRYCSASLH